MEIKFEQQGLLYVAEFEVASNCNLHIERESRGAFTIAQRGTKQGKYAYITDENYDDRTIIDVDMLGNIYPKYIKITSVSKPTYAEVNFGEEGGGSGDDGGLTYFDLSGISIDDIIAAAMNASIVKSISATDAPDMGVNAGDIIILPIMHFMDLGQPLSLTPIAIGIALQEREIFMGLSTTIEDLVKNEIGDEVYNSIPRITKEEFYNI
jgi:hypothetical protein